MPTKNAKRSTSFIRLLLAGRCSQRHPCTGAQNGANSPLGFRLQTRPKRRKSLPGARRRRGSLALSLAGRSTMVYRKGQPRRKCTGGREFTLEGSWYADQEIQSGADRDAAAAGRSGTRQRKNHAMIL